MLQTAKIYVILKSMKWMDVLVGLNNENRVIVRHEPMSRRYWRAAQSLNRILTNGQIIGQYQVSNNIFELVVWVEPIAKYGLYVCFRAFSDRGNFCRAELFCYYDKKDRPKRKQKGFRSKQAAIHFMKAEFPKYEVIYEDF